LKPKSVKLGLNERLRIDFVMNIDGDNFSEPSFDGFKVIAGPSQQVSQSWVNGRSSFRRFIPITLCQIKRSFGNQAGYD
jgi:hypothetical protein